MEQQIALGIDLSLASKEVIEALILDAADPAVFEEILKANTQRPDIIKLLIESPDVPENIREAASRILSPVKAATTHVVKAAPTAEARSQTLLQRMQKLSVSEKRLLAMRGGREVRSILVKDTNKQIVMAVLENPKLTDSEVEIMAHSRSIPDEALRVIAKNKEWMKNYGVLLAIVTNPKTPAGLAIPLLSSLKTRDIATMEKNKNVAEALRTAAKKLMQARRR
jgi:hypothetical protein